MQSHFTQPDLHVRLFGSPGFTFRAQPYAVDRIQNRALLYRLAGDLQPVPRSQLAFLFWPDVPDARAQRLLTQLLSHVRSALPVPELLQTTKDSVQLDPARTVSDSARFAKLCSGGEPPLADLEEAVDLYSGPFLYGVTLPNLPEFDAWIATERSHFEQRYLAALDRLAQHAAGQQQWRKASDLAVRYLAVDELAESMHRLVIECYGAMGERNAAMQQFERCKLVLERELGVSPLPETQDAYNSMLAGRAHAVEPVAPPAPSPTWATLPGPRVPLVGRAELQGRLAALLRQAQAGQGQIVLLNGEAGIGKSRLLQEFATGVQNGALVLAAACHPGLQSLPYQPIVDALRPILRQPKLLARMPQLWLRHLRVLTPELAETSPDPAGLMEPERARAALFEALLQVIASLADENRPVLFCLDDLHWADSATLEWLEFLARQVRSSRLLLCATYRLDEAEGIAELKWSLNRLGSYADFSVPPLDAAEVRQLLDYLEIPSTGALAGHLQTATGGNPFFLLETVQGLVEGGQLATARYNLEQMPVSASLRETVDHRLARLQPVARQVLEAGAVLGFAFSFATLRDVAGRSELETLDGVEELLRRRVLVEENDGFRFNHEVTRSVIYRQLSQWRRRILHRRCAEVLEAELHGALPSDRAVLVAQIGRHFAEADEPAKAVAYLLEAGDHARNLYDHQASIDCYQQALTWLRRQDNPQPAARVLMKLGLTYHTGLNFEAAQNAFDEAFRLYQRWGQSGPALPIPQAPHSLRIVSAEAHPFSYDPAFMAEHSSALLGAQIYSGLVQISPQHDIVPDLAQRWEVQEGGRKYIFHLRRDACWSDRTPLTAHDFHYSWERTLKPSTESSTAYGLYDIRNARAYHEGAVTDAAVLGVRVLDDHTLEVELESPRPYFLYALHFPSFLPVPRHVVEERGAEWATTGGPVTNGAFQPQAWTASKLVVLDRNSEYRGGRGGNVDSVRYYSHDDWPAKLRMYQAGEIDVLYLRDPPTPEMNQARYLLANDYVSLPMFAVDFLGFDVTKPPFDDVRVRQALGLAIDKELLAGAVLQGYRSPAHGGFVPPEMPGHTSRSAMPHDPARARRLLAAAGYPGGRGFPAVEWYTGVPEFQPFADFLVSQWREQLGLDLPYQPAQWEQLWQRLNLSPPQLFAFTWHADYPDPHTFLGNGPPQLYCKWDDEIYNALVAEAGSSTDQAKRMHIYQQLDRMLLEEGVLFPLTYVRYHMLVKPWVKITPFFMTPHIFWKDVVIADH